MRGIRIDLELKEETRASGQTESRAKEPFSVFKEDDSLTRSWEEFEIPTDEHTPKTFTSDMITTQTLLCVVVDMPWRFDKEIEVPVMGRSVIKEVESDFQETI